MEAPKKEKCINPHTHNRMLPVDVYDVVGSIPYKSIFSFRTEGCICMYYFYFLQFPLLLRKGYRSMRVAMTTTAKREEVCY